VGPLTWRLCRGTIEIKMRKAKTILLLAVAAVLLLYSMDCFAPGSADAQAMECCATMPCTPANHSHDCCKTMVFGPSLYIQPPGTVYIAPLQAAAGPPALPAADFPIVLASATRVFADSASSGRAHAPPRKLYTVYLSLLI
jgi:hypothetical protein